MSNGVPLVECDFEFAPVITTLTGGIRATVYEAGGQAPTTIIGTNQDWYVVVEWWIQGGLVNHLCGDWRVSVNLESIGPGDEYQFPQPADVVPMEPCGDGHYRHRINVRAGQVHADEDGTLYLLGVTLASRDACGRPGHIAAYCTGEYLQFYQQAPHT